jgi:hypothetical protein
LNKFFPPAVAGGKNFYKWQMEGIDYSGAAGTGLTVLANHTMTAVYQ